MLDSPGTFERSRMRRVLSVISIGTLAWLTAPSALAIGFGKVAHPTQLGQPLDFSAVVRLDADEVLERRCVFAEVLSGDNRIGADDVRIGLRPGADPAERIVRVTTLHKLDEPVVTVVVGIGCGSRVTRRFVAFLDPPLLRLAQAAEGVGRAAEPATEESQVAPLVALVEPARVERRVASAPSRPRAAARVAPGRSAAPAGPSAGVDVAQASSVQRMRATRRVAVAARAPARKTAGPRLQLDAAEPVVARAPAVTASAVAALASTPAEPALVAATPDPALETLKSALEQERARTQALDAGLARLRTEAAATQQSIAALQARVLEAESARNSLVYLLGGLCALLTIVTLVVLQRRSGGGPRRWFDLTQMPASAPAAVEPDAQAMPADELPADQPWIYRPPRLDAPSASTGSGASSIGGLEVTTVLDHAVLARMVGGDQPAANAPLDDDAAPEPTIDALVDLEQQVDFFLVLGQDDAAIDRLARRCGSSASPLPYFHLLQIHRRRGEEAAFARVAEDYHQRFGAAAPAWDAPAPPDRPIENHPRFFARLQAAWSTPAEAMRTIEDALFRRDPADEMPDFAACRDLLFLYSVARDRAEQPVAAAVDLLLPMDGAPDEEPPLAVLGSPSHFAALYTLPSRPAPLDIDVSVPAPLEDPSSERRKAV